MAALELALYAFCRRYEYMREAIMEDTSRCSFRFAEEFFSADVESRFSTIFYGTRIPKHGNTATMHVFVPHRGNVIERMIDAVYLVGLYPCAILTMNNWTCSDFWKSDQDGKSNIKSFRNIIRRRHTMFISL